MVRPPWRCLGKVRRSEWRVDAVGYRRARLSQQQIDELCQQDRIADVLPLTPLQQGLLFHISSTQGSGDVYAVQLDITLSGALDPHRLREAVHTVVARHPNLVADPALDGRWVISLNTLVLRVDLGGGSCTVAARRCQRRRAQSAGFDIRMAFGGVGGAPQPGPVALNHHPLVQVLLAWGKLRRAKGSGPAAGFVSQVTPLSADTQTARMDW